LKILPLNIDELHEVIKDNEKGMIIVDYDNSRIKKQFFLNYIANIELNIDIDFKSDIDLDLLSLYISNKYDIDIPFLNECFAQVILDVKRVSLENRIMTEKESTLFYQQNKDYIDSIIRFMDSLLIAIPFYNKEYKETIGQQLIDNRTIELIDNESLEISSNLIKILEMKDFIGTYFSVPLKSKPAYYLQQMEGNFYKGNSMFNYLEQTNNTLLVLFKGIAEGWFESEDFLKAIGA